MVHGSHQVHITLHPIHPLSSHHIRLHYTTHHIIQFHLILTSFDTCYITMYLHNMQVCLDHTELQVLPTPPGVEVRLHQAGTAATSLLWPLKGLTQTGVPVSKAPFSFQVIAQSIAYTYTVGLSQLLHLCFVPFPQHFLHFVCVIFS